MSSMGQLVHSKTAVLFAREIHMHIPLLWGTHLFFLGGGGGLD